MDRHPRKAELARRSDDDDHAKHGCVLIDDGGGGVLGSGFNHHVAHDAVRRASTPDNDLLRDGFVARSRAYEVRAPGYEVWITTACDDVSAEVLAAVDGISEPLARANAVRDVKEAIARAREAAAADAGLRCKVQEMWALKTYTLFTQRRIRDVRLVYVPPLCLGAFGGDADNFEWPRHTADFALLRAYVAPDGGAAEPDDANVAYAPSRHLPIAREGAAEGDFVFLLGFPGSTMRYAPASRLDYADEVAVPALVADFGEKLALLRAHATDRGGLLPLSRGDGHGQQRQHAHDSERLLRAHVGSQQLHHDRHRDPLEDVDKQPQERDDARDLAHRRERCGARVRDLGAAFLADRMDHECPGLHMAEPLQGG